ncbi:uncharacterized protein LOC108903905 [Anoplophora glabripennis]|uniref:uncharacterized protein LOC108903905 n=1 Tax=Anoplophora glabripennis TaxID=217634 RepID=UPI0008740EEA|nr:uncharacterized protein LOC108903905 [Anoplophora glabripennis]
MSSTQTRREGHNEELVIDGVLSTQPELGPSIPDGGYGWVVFLATLFFQALIPSLIVSFGIFLAFSRLSNITGEDINPMLWDDKLVYTPLLFVATWTFFDPTARALISNSTWPRLVATAGTCLTCAGLLFLWMGMIGYGGTLVFILAGGVSGIGASIQIAQCEILMAQYFRLKHAVLAHITQAVSAFGFLIAPIVVGHHILSSNLLHVILWYQAIILQGLVLNLTFRKPMYLKSKQTNNYNYVSATADDEEDIFSKNSRELQIKRLNSSGSNVTIEKHTITNSSEGDVAGTSHSSDDNDKVRTEKQSWETFEDNEGLEEPKYKNLQEEWEIFDEEDEVTPKISKPKSTEWEKFEEEEPLPKNQAKNLRLELAFAEELAEANNVPTPNNTTGVPIPIFTDLPVNNNNTYSYDVLEQHSSPLSPPVFMPTTIERRSTFSNLQILQQPTFYKSLLMIITLKFSIFVYFTLFPSYMYQELKGIKMRYISTVVGVVSVTSLFFSAVSYWVNIDKKKRPICMWFLCWVGSCGYFMVSDSDSERVLLFGAVQVTLSIASLQYVGLPLLGLTLRGETNKEFALISMMSGAAFLFFIIINSSYKDCFRLMALLHFFTGAVWFSNYLYKKLKY